MAPPGGRGPRWLRRIGVGIALVVAFLLIGAVALYLKPVDVPTVSGAHDPSASYDDALVRFAAVETREASEDLIPACHSKLLTTGDRTARAVVLLHGYTNCPQMFVKLGEELQARGFNVYIPLAPEHGERDREHSTLAQLTTTELIDHGNAAVDLASGLGDRVTVLGLSGGGAVAAYLGQSRDVDLAVPVSPFLGLRSLPAFLTPALINLADLLPPISWGIPASLASSGTYAPYAGLDNNTRSAAAYLRLGRMTLDAAASSPHAATRTVTILNDGDDTVNNQLAEDLTRRWEARAPADTDAYHFPASLGLPHDVVGPDRSDQRTDVVYPVLLERIGAR